MNTESFIPPPRDLPPGRLVLRTQHLRAAIADKQRHTPLSSVPRLSFVPALVIVALLAALALVPIGGASLGSRAIDSVSGVWRDGLPLEAQQGQPYQPGDKVWTTTPPQNRVAITIPCPNGTIDAAKRLYELDSTFGPGRSPVNEVNCAPGSIPKSALRAQQPLPAAAPYKPGDKVWTTEPPHNGMGDRVAITIDCPNGTIDAARKLEELESVPGSPINEVNCR